MALDGPALGGQRDVNQQLPLQQRGEHRAQVPQVVVPSDNPTSILRSIDEHNTKVSTEIARKRKGSWLLIVISVWPKTL